MSQPSLRALLLTDVVDSTKLTESLGDAAMAELWTAHDRAARDLLPAWRGREIDKTDGMLLLFDAAVDALGYALAYHRALKALALPFTARAGIHVGPVMLRANTADDIARGAKPVEVDGIALPVTARVMSIALGGQTLLSADARLALGVTPSRVQSHGNWRLHGVAEPVELFEIGDADAPFVAPPDAAKAYRVIRQEELWVPVRDVRHSLPAERDSFVGRQEPLQQLAQKLEDGARLVSVLGIGGTGKTRLVTRFAWSWLGDFPGGVWFCDLSQARSVDGIYFAVAQGLDVPLGKTDPVVQLAHAIHGRGKCLVILDNFEQVARHAEETLGRWLDRAAQARFIVTTREVLGIVGEETMALAPLPPSDAATLFLRRAEAARQGYRPSADDLAAIDQLAKVLDGLPLAIELAAARVRVMTPRTLLGRMNERFKLLWSSGGRQDRQATLRAAFDWSWELLSEPEKSALAQLSVFEGGFTLEAAEAVLDLSATGEAPWVVDVVQWLVDKSFVRRVSDERFDLLESVREYAAEHLRTEGRYEGSGQGARESAVARHGEFFALDMSGSALPRSTLDLDNVVAACRRAVLRSASRTAVAALSNAWEGLARFGPFRVASDLVEKIEALPDLELGDRARVHQIMGRVLFMSGKTSAARHRLHNAVELSQRAGDPLCEGRATAAMAELTVFEGRPEHARPIYERALIIATGLGSSRLLCTVLNGLGTLHEHIGEFDLSKERFDAALAEARRAGSRQWEGGTLGNLGQYFANRGQNARALPLYEQSVAIAREMGDRQWEGNMLCNMGLLHHADGRQEMAQSHLKAALAVAQDLGFTRLESVVLCNLGIVMEARNDAMSAQAHFEKAVALARENHDRRSEGQFLGYLGLLQARAGRFESSLAHLDEGAALLTSVGDAISLGILLCGRAELELTRGQHAAAIDQLAKVSEIARQAGIMTESELGIAIARIRKALLRSDEAIAVRG